MRPLSTIYSDDGIEATPLLLDGDDNEDTVDDTEGQTPLERSYNTTPLPKMQIFLLCWMRVSEPLSFNVIYPFINEMLVSVGITNPGYSSGLIDGVFAFAQLWTAYYFGSLSDRIGRKPVLLIGLSGAAIFTGLFGFSTSLAMILFFRMLVGAFGGNSAILKSAIAELTDETNQGRAFSLIILSWSIGGAIAPLMGGFLARPAERFPAIFGTFPLFIKFPYLLACMAGAGTTLLGAFAGYLFLNEPRTTSAYPTNLDHENTSPLFQGAPDTSQHLSAKEIMQDMIIRRVITSYIFMAAITASVNALFVLWLFTPVTKGGIGFTTAEIGLALSWLGISGTFVNLIVFPPFQRKMGTITIYRACFVMQTIIVMLFPTIRLIALAECGISEPRIADEVVPSSPGMVTKATVGLMVLLKSFGGMIFACNMILVNSASPSRSNLGAVNGLALTIASLIRACAPTIATIFFALSNDPKYHLLDGQFTWIYMLGLAVGGVLTSLRVQEGRSRSDVVHRRRSSSL
ncbi:hypothetical protein FRC03_012946 [Tulasnella sp. 419]|nr:hypothetical protein FRC03_012946 [Tulasnella sp. 419]